MDRRLESNKQAAVTFLKLAFVDKKPEEAIRLYVGTTTNSIIPAYRTARMAFSLT